jgi:hypothetical protein
LLIQVGRAAHGDELVASKGEASCQSQYLGDQGLSQMFELACAVIPLDAVIQVVEHAESRPQIVSALCLHLDERTSRTIGLLISEVHSMHAPAHEGLGDVVAALQERAAEWQHVVIGGAEAQPIQWLEAAEQFRVPSKSCSVHARVEPEFGDFSRRDPLILALGIENSHRARLGADNFGV